MRRTSFCVLVTLGLSGCILRPAPFACTEDDQCALDGRPGFCVGGTCTADGPTTGSPPTTTTATGAATDVGSGTSMNTIGSESDSPDASSSGGEECTACLYVSPEGDDENEGSRGAPWGTIARAVAASEPGSRIVLLDGAYGVSTTGLVTIDCTVGNRDGTAAAPITLAAENERAALISGDGQSPSVELRGCQYWHVEGLHAIAPVTVDRSQHVELRRLLVTGGNDNGITVLLSEDVLVEETEVYDFTGNGFRVERSSDVSLRRCYGNPRAEADGVFEVAGSVDTRFDNCVAEEDVAFKISGANVRGEKTTAEGTTLAGCIGIGGARGIAIRESSIEGDVTDTLVMDTVIRNAETEGIRAQASAGTVVEHSTFIVVGNQMSTTAVQTSDALGNCEMNVACSIVVRNTLAVGGEVGFRISEQQSELIEFCNAAGHTASNRYRIDGNGGEPIDDAMGSVRNSAAFENNLGIDTCLLRTPASSPLFGAGEDGANIGAALVFRYEGGASPTDEALWNPDGSFPCGTVVAGVNDRAGRSCFDLHERVPAEGCPQ